MSVWLIDTNVLTQLSNHFMTPESDSCTSFYKNGCNQSPIFHQTVMNTQCSDEEPGIDKVAYPR